MRRPTIYEKVPEHLHPFIATQDASLYTPIDHASWRYIMRISKTFFAERAHQKYLDGLKETGISLDRVPLISEMDEKLQTFGWRAVAVVGFIPPAVFMEFLSLGVLPIACDMRRLEHLSYTPAPDIVHEAAGHAPIIADQEYADYLHQYGEVSRKVIFSDQDISVYEAIRNLSDLKEDPASTAGQIEAAQKRLDDAVAAVDYVSEATELARMSWWTIEYGLVGDLNDPKIYGAGLLSSVGESFHCFGEEVRKIPFSIDCVKMSYDITKPQPQLYVTPDFGTLSRVLDQFAETLAFRIGGLEALERAKKAKTTTTAILDSGVQVSGTLIEILAKKGEPFYLRYEGPCQLSFADMELDGQGASYHAQGFSTPVGRLSSGKNIHELSERELDAHKGVFEFESGVVVRGKLARITREQELNVVLSFEACTVKYGDRVLFDPSWGTFDLACGSKVRSVFGGAADRGKYMAAIGGYGQKPGKPKTNLTEENRALNALYSKVRVLREKKSAEAGELSQIIAELNVIDRDDWLLRLELLEFNALDAKSADQLRAELSRIAKGSKDKAELISRGLKLL